MSDPFDDLPPMGPAPNRPQQPRQGFVPPQQPPKKPAQPLPQARPLQGQPNAQPAPQRPAVPQGKPIPQARPLPQAQPIPQSPQASPYTQPYPNQPYPPQPYPPQAYPPQNYPPQPYPPQNYPQLGSVPPGLTAQSPYVMAPKPYQGGRGSGSMRWLWILLSILGGSFALVVLLCGGSFYYVTNYKPAMTATARKPFEVAQVPLPAFPQREPGVEVGKDFTLQRIPLGTQSGGYYTTPGHGGSMYLFLPNRPVQNGTLPCVMFCGAGTTLLHGYELDQLASIHSAMSILKARASMMNSPDTAEAAEPEELDLSRLPPGATPELIENLKKQHEARKRMRTIPAPQINLQEIEIPLDNGDIAECVPYVKAGYAVIAFEQDGPIQDVVVNVRVKVSDEQVAGAYKSFSAAQAGLVNARNAFEYVRQHVPEVNQSKIFIAGHSSAGTMALLFAEHEPRLAGCIAFAPCVDLASRFRGTKGMTLASKLPNFGEFVNRSSPKTHLDEIRCPVFLYHARGDKVTPFKETEDFADKLRNSGKNVTFKPSDDVDHYYSMRQEGIPLAIEWLKERTR